MNLGILLLGIIVLASPQSTYVENNSCIWLSVKLPKRFELGKKSRARACRWEKHVQKFSNDRNIDPDLINALIVVESRWKPWVVSPANACGLTQVIPRYTGKAATRKKRWSCKDLLKPFNSLRAGTDILSWWIKYRKGNIKEALCGYNAGFRTCKRAGAKYAYHVLRLQSLLKKERATLAGINLLEKNN